MKAALKEPVNTKNQPDHTPTPRVLANPNVWMESAAVEQLSKVAALPDCISVVGMPDLHVGPGFPIGAVAAFRNTIYPLLFGSDAGCGARLVVAKARITSFDKLERRMRAAMDEPPWGTVAADELLEVVWRHGARGLADVDALPDDLRAVAHREPEEPGASNENVPELYEPYADALGTIGGGNHFLEVGRVREVVDDTQADLRKTVTVLAHSGSRGLGYALCNRWGADPLRGADMAQYLRELAGALRFARANRLLLTYRALRALGASKVDKHRLSVDVTHNTVSKETVDGVDCWVHRKGAAPAATDQLTLVLGSRGAPSWLMRGLGSSVSLCSVAHGAGRRMGRGEAVSKLRNKYRRNEVARTPLGGRVICDDPALLFEEHPDAYKDIGPVIESLVEYGAARPVLSLEPVLTVKV